MDFVVYLIQTVVKMLVIVAVGFGGICLGKTLRDRKDAKQDEKPGDNA